ncbi:hypothetical protein SVAN01_09156 [Stagonosporopsis vannaccii]|nr:hypothetical protein SVAN01_09156 [Stagonosporopsis vannaccii]
MRKDARTIERFGRQSGPDVLLLVGPGYDRQTFVLSESILRQVSPRWGSLLSSPSISKGQCCRWFSKKTKTLNLRDDRPESIRLVLLIATLQFDKVPKALDFVDIVHLTDVAVRYEAHSLLAGYMDGWLAPYRDRLREWGYEGWLYIAQQFRYEVEYAELAKFIVMHCEVDSTGEKLMVSGSSCAIGGRIPLDTLAQIHENRRQLLCNILKATYDLWTRISRGTNCKLTQASDPNVQRQCAAVNLLALTAHLRALGLFPMLRTPTSIQSSPRDLSLRLADISNTLRIEHVVTARRRSSAPAEPAKHTRCHVGFKLRAAMTSIMEDVRWSTSRLHLAGRHDKEQCGKYLCPASRNTI